MYKEIIEEVNQWVTTWGMIPQYNHLLTTGIILGGIIFLSLVANWISQRVILSLIKQLVKRSKSTWDDILLEKKVFNKLSRIAPALIIHYLIPEPLAMYPDLVGFIQLATMIYMVIVTLSVINALVDALHDIYLFLPISRDRSIKGYVQIVKILVYSVGIILVLSIIFDKSITAMLAGLGALAAVLLLVFKDTILGFVASIQLSINDMIRPGDWIAMPSHNADGTVIDMTLYTVKVQNWDRTITTIPTYTLVSESFSNWRGMEESGGRRIKRSILIDARSVKFCTPEMVEKFKRIQVLKTYISRKEEEIGEYNKQLQVDDSVMVNGRRMTNLGTFRAYLDHYLANHPGINLEMTHMVRQLQPTENGIPLEIYVFSSDKAWVNYENLQSDIFDHILAVIPEFELRVFQNPTGEDFRKIFEHTSQSN
jgi:miniconductance mechanosensitive channel